MSLQDLIATFGGSLFMGKNVLPFEGNAIFIKRPNGALEEVNINERVYVQLTAHGKHLLEGSVRNAGKDAMEVLYERNRIFDSYYPIQLWELMKTYADCFKGFKDSGHYPFVSHIIWFELEQEKFIPTVREF